MKIDCSKNNSIRNPFFGIGMEKLDRDAFDPNGIYDKVAALGVRWVRLQSGWAKTEKEKGKYFVSLRSQSKYNVCNIAKSFGGGGHVRASGFDMKASKSALLKALLSACRKEIDSIDKTN